jgi:hypothetical protein
VSSQYISVNREAIWAALLSYLEARLTGPAWQPNTVYTTGAIIADPNGHLQQATVGGTSGATIPTFNESGGTTTDGTAPSQITWTDTGQGFVSIGRKHKAPPDLTMAEQPALFVVQVKEEHKPKPRGVPNRLVLHGFLILYVAAPVANEIIGQETVLAATTLNTLFQAIDQALLPDNLTQGAFTLGGLVSHCWIDGDTDQDPGIWGAQAAAVIPLHILVP